MAIPFVRTTLKDWDLAEKLKDTQALANIPNYSAPLPVISCIGSSRDGKSTLLNIMHKVMHKIIAPVALESQRSPFISKNGNNMTTNGIDFVTIPGNCILVDCQGMALSDAKYDHFLTLIIYLISNVIVLNVRQRLDLQILNNLLAVFSFLSEIPPEHRRPEKPTLVIRLKDFQDFELLNEDPDFLKNYVNDWLKKSGDQYDHIKEAFSMAFDIQIVVTEYPKFLNKTSTLNIYDTTFDESNASFIDACEKIIGYAHAHKLTPNKLLTDKNNMRKLIHDLKNNANIDYRKLDLYHNVTSLELTRYVLTDINIEPYNDESILEKMNGTYKAYQLYTERKKQIDNLMNKTFNVKFKDVTQDLKDEIFGKLFFRFQNIVNMCEDTNKNKARELIKKDYETFENKFAFSDPLFGRLVNDVLGIFFDHKNDLTKTLIKVDKNLMEDIMIKLDAEELLLKTRQNEINAMNQQIVSDLVANIKKYDPKLHHENYIEEELDIQLWNCEYNLNADEMYKIVSKKTKSDLVKIYKQHKITYYLGADKSIKEKKVLNYNVTNHIPVNNADLYWSLKMQKMTDIVFLKNVDIEKNSCIQFIRLTPLYEAESLLMTSVAFVKMYFASMITFFNNYNLLVTEHKESMDAIIKNHTYIDDDGKIQMKIYTESADYIDHIKHINKPIVEIVIQFPANWEYLPDMMVNAIRHDFYRAIMHYITLNTNETNNIILTNENFETNDMDNENKEDEKYEDASDE